MRPRRLTPWLTAAAALSACAVLWFRASNGTAWHAEPGQARLGGARHGTHLYRGLMK